MIIGALQTLISDLPENVKAGFLAVFPDYLQLNTKDKIKALIEIALLRIVVDKKAAVLEDLAQTQTNLTAMRTEDANKIIEKTASIKTAIADYEEEMVEKLPSWLQPITDAYQDELEGQIIELENEIMVNIDQIAPDVLGIDHLVESFPSSIICREYPNIKNSELFHINDVYRLLCNHFDRAERIALIVHLANQDLPDDIGDFLN